MKKIVFILLASSLSFNFVFAQAVSVTGSERKKTVKPKTAVKPAASKSNSTKAVVNKNFWNAETASPIFIIQNIATEKMRVYKRCVQTSTCAHELLFEADMIAGHSTSAQNDPNVFATKLGHFKIAKWTKFFEDKNGKFPAWYKSDSSIVPKGSAPKEWIGNRGAYGWLTAQLGPNADEQVIHGTYGWGSDKESFLTYFRNPFVKFIDDPMAIGATRVENQAIAYTRHLAEIGTDVLRVYALEAYADQTLVRYDTYRAQKPFWDWVLTNSDAQKDAVSIDRQVQLKKNYVYSNVIEEGRFEIDRYPTGMPYSTTLFGLGAGSGTTGNTYQIKRKQFKGVFLVDEGRFVDYEHPQVTELPVSGYPQHVLPNYVIAKSTTYVLIPAAKTAEDNNNR